MIPSPRLTQRLGAQGARALLLGVAAIGVAAASAVPVSASENNARLGAGIGSYDTAANGVTANSGVTGTATMTVKNRTATVETRVRGLKAGSRHVAHIQRGTCNDQLGNNRPNPKDPVAGAYDVGLPLTANQQGQAASKVNLSNLDLGQPLYMVVQQNANPGAGTGSQPGPRIACGDLVAARDLKIKLGPYVKAATGVILNTGVKGNATMVTDGGTTKIHLTATGLKPNSKHAAHLHVGTCAQQGAHFQYQPKRDLATRANEVWLDLKAGGDGRASADVQVRPVESTKPLSIVIHQGPNSDVVKGMVPGSRIACGSVQTPQQAPGRTSQQVAPGTDCQQASDSASQQALIADCQQAPPGTDCQQAPVMNPQYVPATDTRNTPAADTQQAPVTNSQYAPAMDSRNSPATNSQQTPGTDCQQAPDTNPQYVPATDTRNTPGTNCQKAPAEDTHQAPVTTPQLRHG